ncbi:MAG: hypothetical protein JWN52_7363 [Actinomycetia bacterium]|nr:hypothetical protein [Actinomycetes bacterium]
MSIYMNTPTRSPLVRATIADIPEPAPHTRAELATLLALVKQPKTKAVVIGHGRDEVSRASAAAFAQAWEQPGGHVLDVIDWPEEAASWLRPARRFTAGEPDAWVVAAPVPGWAQMARRLRASTGWTPERTFGFASVGVAQAVAMAGADSLEGMRGATVDGGTWRAGPGWMTYRPAEPAEEV